MEAAWTAGTTQHRRHDLYHHRHESLSRNKLWCQLASLQFIVSLSGNERIWLMYILNSTGNQEHATACRDWLLFHVL